MIDFTIIISFIIASAGIGYFSSDLLPPGSLKGVTNLDALRLVVAVFAALIGGAVGLSFQTSYRRLEAQVKEMPIEVILTRAIGLVIGLLLANLTLAPLFLLPIPADFSFIKPLVAVVGSIILSVTGMNLADTHGRGLLRLINPNTVETLVVEGTLKPANTKVLDTSCIIDGRVELLLETGFLEGLIIVPQFILQELQQVADATKDVKRVRGRRGLEILNRIRENYPERIVINSVEYDDLSTVDKKLVKFAKEINGTLLTNEYNL